MLKSSYSGHLVEAGCDEAGRGCLAGPVFAAAVILPKNYRNEVLNDSKQLSARLRETLRVRIEQEAVCWAIAAIDNETIDKVNILNASIMAMHEAIGKLAQRPGLILADGNRFHPYPGISHQCIVKGDATYMSIAAASILAKTYRDGFMKILDDEFPEYGWKNNKGYPTSIHRAAIARLGLTPYHRRSFHVSGQLSFFLSESRDF